MTTRNVVVSIDKIDLSVAGSKTIGQEMQLLMVTEIMNGSSLALDGVVTVHFDQQEGNGVNLRTSNKIFAANRRIHLSWEAQAGYTATIMTTNDPAFVDADTSPPVRLVTGATGGSIDRGSVSVSTSATEIVAANSSRKSVILQNNGGGNVYLGNSSVTASGFYLASGQSITLDKTTAAIYGIVSTGSCSVSYLGEV